MGGGGIRNCLGYQMGTDNTQTDIDKTQTKYRQDIDNTQTRHRQDIEFPYLGTEFLPRNFGKDAIITIVRQLQKT